MSGKPSFIGMLTYGVRTLFWRPVQSLVYIAVVSFGYLVFYTWSASDAGMDFYTRYALSMTPEGGFDFGTHIRLTGMLFLGSTVAAVFMYAAAFRILVREEVRPWSVFQLGRDELNMLALFILIGIIMIGAAIVTTIVAMLLMLVLSFVMAAVMMASAPGEPGMTTIVMVALLMALMFLPVIYIVGRLSVSMPLSIKQRRMTMDGWSLSRPVGLSLLGAHVAVYAVMAVVLFLLAPEVWMQAFSPEVLAAGGLDPAAQAQTLARPYGDMTLVAIPLQALMSLLMLGPVSAVAAKVE